MICIVGEWSCAPGAWHLHGDRVGQSPSHPHSPRGVSLPTALCGQLVAVGGRRWPLRRRHVEQTVRHGPLLRRALRHRYPPLPTATASLVCTTPIPSSSFHPLLTHFVYITSTSSIEQRVGVGAYCYCYCAACRSRRSDTTRRSARVLRCCAHFARPQRVRMLYYPTLRFDSIRFDSIRLRSAPLSDQCIDSDFTDSNRLRLRYGFVIASIFRIYTLQ